MLAPLQLLQAQFKGELARVHPSGLVHGSRPSYNRPLVGLVVNSSVMRLIDANANRAREALRVLEDYARFVLDSSELCEALKGIRHELMSATRDLLAEAILHRDTPEDVGTGVTSVAEMRREGVNEVVTAAGKRLGEALRTIEEYLKVISPMIPSPGTPGEGQGGGSLMEITPTPSLPRSTGGGCKLTAAAMVESLRYRFYDIEQRLARTLRPAALFANVRLCVLITESACRGDWFAAAQAAIRGGADCLQLREKDLDDGELLRRAIRFVELCRRHGVISIINDRPDIALLASADGVHVGQDDLPAVEVRKIVGCEKIIGVSTHRIEQARQAVLDGADYIGVGPIFHSPTKPRDFVAGLEYAKQVVEQIKIPSVAIAGITEANIEQVLATGIKAVAVTAAVVGCEDVESAARSLKDRINRKGAKNAKENDRAP